MSTFRQKLRTDVVNPALHGSGRTTLVAVIISKEKRKYTIELINSLGQKQIIEDVKVRVYDKNNLVGYEIGQKVLVEAENNEYEIISLQVDNMDELISYSELKTDVYSDLGTSTLPGFIF